MTDTIVLSVTDIIGSDLCIASDDGEKVHAPVAAALRDGSRVELSFRGISLMTTAFLNAAIGQLCGEFEADLIEARMSVSGLEEDDRVLLKRVIETARKYFRERERYENVKREVLGDDDAD